jgi:uridine kinase
MTADKSEFLPLFCRIDELLKLKKRVVCAIDGACASGKTTLAAMLKAKYLCNVFPMDDFFLRPFQRTAERLGEPGGNVDYERFLEEVLTPLAEDRAFAYRPYDCSSQSLSDEVRVTPRPLNIVEGVYSLHPALSGYYDLKVFLKTEPEEQKFRLIQRDKKLYGRFVSEWMPLENKYFGVFQVESLCDFVFGSDGAEARPGGKGEKK